MLLDIRIFIHCPKGFDSSLNFWLTSYLQSVRGSRKVMPGTPKDANLLFSIMHDLNNDRFYTGCRD